ncbi:hypothetical protein NKI86_32360, partial [Mesorhizobium sp. M0320]|uniref:hypothetical protein n=1 Tax=Mesorhizobium sp. M0320 TaxID=2956936 RepID=UPI00333D6200
MTSAVADVEVSSHFGLTDAKMPRHGAARAEARILTRPDVWFKKTGLIIKGNKTMRNLAGQF